MTQNYIGVDLSSGWIDIHDPLRGVLRIIIPVQHLRLGWMNLGVKISLFLKPQAAVIAQSYKKHRPVASQCVGSIRCMDGTSDVP